MPQSPEGRLQQNASTGTQRAADNMGILQDSGLDFLFSASSLSRQKCGQALCKYDSSKPLKI